MGVDVQRRHPQQEGIVAEQAEALIAPLTEQPSDPAAEVVMIKVLRPRGAADGAQITLCFAECA
nr:hypothetical protein [uncultured Arthrobacter sp.]